MDVVAVRAAGEKAVEHARSGEGPYILEMQTYRYRGHSMSDPAKYRTKEEVDKYRNERDPIDHVRKILLDGKMTDEAALKAVDARDPQDRRTTRRSSRSTVPSPIRPSCGPTSWSEPDPCRFRF